MKNNYQIKKLNEVCEILIGGTPSRGNSMYWKNGTLPWVSIRDMSREGKFMNETKEKITEKGAKESNVKLIPKGTLLFSFKLSIGKLAFAGEDLYTNEAIAGLVIKDKKELNNDYLYYFLSQMTFDDTTSAVKGKTLNKEKIKKLEIPLPPLETQKKIVEILDEKFAKIREAKSLREQSIADTEKILSQTLREIFEEGKAKGWEEDILNNVATKVADGTHDTPKYQSKGFPLITSKNLLESGLDFSNIKYISEEDYIQIKQRSGVNKGDLLIAMIGTIGNITRVETEQKFSIKNVGLIKPNENKVLGKYIMYFLHNSRLMSLIESKGATQKFIALGPIRNIKIEFPPLIEQKKIVERLDALSEKIRQMVDLQKSQLEDFKKLEKSYLREAFNGELV